MLETISSFVLAHPVGVGLVIYLAVAAFMSARATRNWWTQDAKTAHLITRTPEGVHRIMSEMGRKYGHERKRYLLTHGLLWPITLTFWIIRQVIRQVVFYVSYPVLVFFDHLRERSIEEAKKETSVSCQICNKNVGLTQPHSCVKEARVSREISCRNCSEVVRPADVHICTKAESQVVGSSPFIDLRDPNVDRQDEDTDW